MRYNFFLFSFLCSLATGALEVDWGFYGHRLINETAVFTLPVELIPLYKGNIEFVREHSVDPDKRRHASKLEAVRHYIDLDIWGAYPFEEVPRTFEDALLTYGTAYLINIQTQDTVQRWSNEDIWTELFTLDQKEILAENLKFKIFETLDEGFLQVPRSWMPKGVERASHKIIYIEEFSQYGILPFHLEIYQSRLTKAFEEQNWPLVLRLSTELGHYLSDAHVPLHTTENYNGQLTGQDGIHAFWESRIPELFAASSYDFFVGRAKYIEDTKAYFWDVVLESHTHVDEVLSKELELRSTFAKDRQYCYEERGARTTRLECQEYAGAYQDAMEGMVEDRMRKSIQGVGSCWYTAWVDAGRPDLDHLVQSSSIDTLGIPSIEDIHK